MLNDNVTVFLIAPNVSEQMGGEAMKALQIFEELRKKHKNTIQITHERNRAEVVDRLKLENTYLIEDDNVSLFLWNSVFLRWLVNIWFCKKSVKLAESIAEKNGLDRSQVIIHQTEPNSPVMPRVLSKKYRNFFGPINGNIYYPKIFRSHETLRTKLRRLMHFPFQYVNKILFRGAVNADLLLIAGGERTKVSMIAGGVRNETMFETLDCGIQDDLLQRSRVTHADENYRFVHFGRLVFHKGTALIIESLARTKLPVVLDIVGKGPELERCQALAEALGVKDRVNFLGWFTNREDLFDSFPQYRGFVLPSMEDANGIVVQEGMALGLPAICLDWGGPQLLVENGVTGYLVQSESKEALIDEMATYLDNLASDGSLAEKMSIASRARAEQWCWSALIESWLDQYSKCLRS